MAKRRIHAHRGMRAGLWLAATISLLAVPFSKAQSGDSYALEQTGKVRPHPLPERLPEKPSLQPAFSIPVDSLGFSPPGPIYLGQRVALVSLGFLDENRLLFTFRVPGLIRREKASSDESDIRMIRAVVLALPAGTVESEALWTVHDRGRYVWMLNNGQFLLRDRNNLETGDSALELKPYLQFPGHVLWLEMDPLQQYIVSNSREPVGDSKSGNVDSPPTASASVTVNGEKAEDPSDLVVRILRRDSGQVMLVSRIRVPVHLPINADGYLESLRGTGTEWILNLNYFSGGSTVVGRLNSICSPTLDFLSQQEVLAATCNASGGHSLVAMATDGRRLWEDAPSGQPVWPEIAVSGDGARLVRETLAVNHPVNASMPLDSDDIKGQLVEVLDAANGRLELTATASPVFDAGGNVAISPSSRRIAVLNGGAIQVFELPAPLGLSQTGKTGSGH